MGNGKIITRRHFVLTLRVKTGLELNFWLATAHIIGPSVGPTCVHMLIKLNKTLKRTQYQSNLTYGFSKALYTERKYTDYASSAYLTKNSKNVLILLNYANIMLAQSIKLSSWSRD